MERPSTGKVLLATVWTLYWVSEPMPERMTAFLIFSSWMAWRSPASRSVPYLRRIMTIRLKLVLIVWTAGAGDA